MSVFACLKKKPRRTQDETQNATGASEAANLDVYMKAEGFYKPRGQLL